MAPGRGEPCEMTVGGRETLPSLDSLRAPVTESAGGAQAGSPAVRVHTKVLFPGPTPAPSGVNPRGGGIRNLNLERTMDLPLSNRGSGRMCTEWTSPRPLPLPPRAWALPCRAGVTGSSCPVALVPLTATKDRGGRDEKSWVWDLSSAAPARSQELHHLHPHGAHTEPRAPDPTLCWPLAHPAPRPHSP